MMYNIPIYLKPFANFFEWQCHYPQLKLGQFEYPQKDWIFSTSISVYFTHKAIAWLQKSWNIAPNVAFDREYCSEILLFVFHTKEK